MPCRVVTQLPSEALVVKSKVLLLEFNRGGMLQQLLLKHAYAQQSEMIQSAVCHSLHTIRQRLCWWLLVISDSMQSNSFDVTQEHIANMRASAQPHHAFHSRTSAGRADRIRWRLHEDSRSRRLGRGSVRKLSHCQRRNQSTLWCNVAGS